jgi:MFS family permease
MIVKLMFFFLNQKLILDFFTQQYHESHVNDTKNLQDLSAQHANMTNENVTLNMTPEEKNQTLIETKLEIEQLSARIIRVTEMNTHLWTLTNTLFVVGGMIGAFTSKYVADFFGRKKGILFHYIFVVAGSILVIIAPYVKSPECVIVSRFLFGIQGGMCCGLIPTYLSEISPVALRGATGVMHQLCVTIGILIAQLLGFRQLMGIASLWHFLLGLPIVPAILGGLSLMFFFPETPRALLTTNKDEDAAREG